MRNLHGVNRRDFLGTALAAAAGAGTGGLSLWGEAVPKADWVIHGSPVFTVDYLDSVRGAVAVRGDKILATAGGIDGLREFIGPGTRVIRHAGGCVTPGIIDVHNHIVAQAANTPGWVDLIRCTSSREVRETLAQWILEHDWPPGAWVRGVGYMWVLDKMGGEGDGLNGPPLITRWDLDRVVEVDGRKVDLSRYPVFLFQLSGHYATANGPALVEARVMDRSGRFYSGRDDECLTVRGRRIGETFSPEAHAFGSFFNVEEHGGTKQIDGRIFHHYAIEEFLARATKLAGYPPFEEREVGAALRLRCGEFLRRGVTSIYDNNLRCISLLETVRRLPAEAKPSEKLKITLYPYICDLNKGAFPAFDGGGRKGVTSRAPLFEGDWVRLVGYKLQVDAAAMTGFTWEPSNSRGDRTRGKLNLWRWEDLLEVVKTLDGMGAQVSTHVVGDKALDWTLDAYEGTNSARRHRLEHLPCVPPVSRNSRTGKTTPIYSRARDMGVVLCPQPGFILYYAPFFEQAFGPGTGDGRSGRIHTRVTHSIPFRSALEAGVRVALSSDSPCVMDPSPTIALWESIHRRTRPLRGEGKTRQDGYVYNHPDGKGTLFDERVTFHQALRGHTLDAAYAGFEDRIKGSIEEGKAADLVLWNSDLRDLAGRMPVTEAVKIKPVLTLVDGEEAYRDEGRVRIERV